MQKRFVQAASMAALILTLATPAFAKGNGHEGNDDRGKGRGFGAMMAVFHEKDRDGERREEKKGKDVQSTQNTACNTAASQARDAAVSAARQVYETALATAKAAYQKADHDAVAARDAARQAARTAYEASDKGVTAKGAFAMARIKANADWRTARIAAWSVLSTAKNAAQTVFQTAKAKAETDFGTAKAACVVTPVPVTDTTAPAVITNLALSGATSSTIVLTWTAPGDDAAVGTATSYDIRYSTSPITNDALFLAATQVSGEPTPAVAGTSQTKTVVGLAANTAYYFAMKTSDEVPNVSALSNDPSLVTLVAQQ